MQVEIWSDLVCPWCYLGKRRFERALESFGHRDEVTVVYRSFELDPSAPAGVTTPTVERLADKYGMTAGQADDAQRQMEQRAAQDGLEFRMDGLRSGNTRDAHRLLHLAKAHGVQAELAERLHRAYFTEQASIFDHSSLTELAVEAGLDRDDVTRRAGQPGVRRRGRHRRGDGPGSRGERRAVVHHRPPVRHLRRAAARGHRAGAGSGLGGSPDRVTLRGPGRGR